MLTGQQMSISAIARELNEEGLEGHRLVITGYLKALRDMGVLREEDIPPSKLYSYHGKKKGMTKDVHALVRKHIEEVDVGKRFMVSVFVMNTLFNRPCFRQELTLIGTTPKKTDAVKTLPPHNLEKHRAAIKKIDIPANDPGYECIGMEKHPEIMQLGLDVMAGVIRDAVDLSGLYPKDQQAKITTFATK